MKSVLLCNFDIEYLLTIQVIDHIPYDMQGITKTTILGYLDGGIWHIILKLSDDYDQIKFDVVEWYHDLKEYHIIIYENLIHGLLLKCSFHW